VVQRNLVYIVGLPLNLADEDVRHFFLEKPVIISYDLLSYGLTGIFLFSFQLLQRKEYFGQYGKVLKVSMSRTATGLIQQFPNNTCSVYITYGKEEEAIRCIQSVHGFILDGKALKACFGTTKYCHAWLRNVVCPICTLVLLSGPQKFSFSFPLFS
jgi:CCR4-NOT transcription complex subunit 4